jgi:hypothetical protein
MHGFKSFERGLLNYVLKTPPAAQTVERGLAAGYAAVVNELVPEDGDSTTQVFTSQPLEVRNEGVLGLNYYFDPITVSVSGGVSDERDFESTFGAGELAWELDDRLTTLKLGYGYTANRISRVERHGGDQPHVHKGDREYPELDEVSTYDGLSVGVARVLSANTLLQVSASYTAQRGYLSNPYKLVYIRGEITPEEYAALNLQQAVFQDVTDLDVAGVELFREVRPDQRNQWAFSTQLRQYLPSRDAALHLDYRYYRDDWGIDAHTLETRWYQGLPDGFTLTPSIRYYSQAGADFYAPYFLEPRSDGFYSSDYRLSGYGALSSGLTLRKEFDRGFTLQAGVEYYTHEGGLKLGGGGVGDFADFHSWLIHASLELDLEREEWRTGVPAPGAHRHHGEAGAYQEPPAGVMFGHRLERAGDLMVGYRYMYASGEGGMRRGTRQAGDPEVAARACLDRGCTATPKQMDMGMQMLHLMYAPTDWLSLEVMPTLENMEMSMRPLEGAAEADSHDASHRSDGIGDTVVAALLKVYEGTGQHLHLGLGLSVPTGAIEATLDGTVAEGSELQDYGMQLGSGTWDFLPSLTYTGEAGSWSWGAQLGGTKRLQDENSQGYRLGDEWQALAWGSYRLSRWLGASLRATYTDRGDIQGETDRRNAQATPPDFPENYGGRFWDLGLGLSLTVPDGAFAGHGLRLEWVEPIRQDSNGYQLERQGTFFANWSYHF